MPHVLPVQLGRAGLAGERTAEGGRIPAVELTTGCAAGWACPACKLLKFNWGKHEESQVWEMLSLQWAAGALWRKHQNNSVALELVKHQWHKKLSCHVNIKEFGCVVRICSLKFAIKLWTSREMQLRKWQITTKFVIGTDQLYRVEHYWNAKKKSPQTVLFVWISCIKEGWAEQVQRESFHMICFQLICLVPRKMEDENA